MAATMFAHHVFVADGGKVSISRAQRRTASQLALRSRIGGAGMPMRDAISPDLSATLRALKLGQMLHPLPDRLTLARQQKMTHADVLSPIRCGRAGS
jgi:hypothetical protein